MGVSDENKQPGPGAKHVVIHTDGGCHGNPGPGGWAATLHYQQHRREISGGEAATTNNRMELTAAIEALNTLKEPCEIEFFTDSQYVKNGITKWVAGWKAKNWRIASKKPVKNADLWRALDAAAARHRIKWEWVKGHAGHAGNERCDELANEAIAEIKSTHTPQHLKAALTEFVAANAAPPGDAMPSLL